MWVCTEVEALGHKRGADRVKYAGDHFGGNQLHMPRHLVQSPAPLRRAILAAALAGALTGLAGCTPSGLAERPAVGSFAYRIGPGDRLRIATYGEDRLTGEFTVTAQGAIAFPLLGEVAAEGRTVSEFTALLQRRLGSEYMRNPQVSVEMVNFRPVYILGEVTRPGEFPYGERLSVYALVAKAGGFTYRANQGYALIRSENEPGERAVRLTSATAVQPGDTIRIPERTF